MAHGWRVVAAFLAARALSAEEGAAVDASECPLPPEKSLCGKQCPFSTALASHPRAGSTWTRFLLERATGLPCGSEKPDWANVLPHTGQFTQKDPKGKILANSEGVVTKTHSSCYGCWPEAPVQEERLTISRNTTINPKKIVDVMGREYLQVLDKLGNCLMVQPHTLESLMQRIVRSKRQDRWNFRTERSSIEAPCKLTYDRAIVLIRDPLDIVRSNYHYRSAVLSMRPLNSWSQGKFKFPLERGLSFNDFYRTWERFGEVKPALFVRYEDLKANTSSEVRRMLDFLGFPDVPQSKIDCAIEASAIDKLKETQEDRTRGLAAGADMFFGSRDQTEQREKLEYPDFVIDKFEASGLFELSARYGYPPRPAPTGFTGEEPDAGRAGKGGRGGKGGKGGKGGEAGKGGKGGELGESGEMGEPGGGRQGKGGKGGKGEGKQGKGGPDSHGLHEL